MRELLRGLSEELQGYDERLKKLEQLIQREAREDERVRRLMCGFR